MSQKITELAEYFVSRIPAVFLVGVIAVLALILFLPDDYAKAVAVYVFRQEYRSFLGPAFLITISLCAARIYLFFIEGHNHRKHLQKRYKLLHELTPEEKGYLQPYIIEKQNSVHVSLKDGVMAGLLAKEITYHATWVGSEMNGFAFNLQPWAKRYLDKNPDLLKDAKGRPMTPYEKEKNGIWPYS